VDIVSDPIFIDLLTTGNPYLKVPSPNTVRRDVNAVYAKYREHIIKLLQNHPGHIHIATGVWTSIKHRSLLVWTVHHEHEGRMLAFLLDIVQVPESYDGMVLAMAFQNMLRRYELKEKVC
jgi:hypothetical protein